MSPENFAAHMDVLRRRGETRRLSELTQCLRSEGPAEKSVAVTFDDGYVDNLTHALPILEATKIPATVFVTSGLLGVEYGFWWDALSRIFLETPSLPQRLTLTSSARRADWDLGASAQYAPADLARNAGWSADEDQPRDLRQKTFLKVWEFIVGLEPVEQRDLIAGLASWAGVPARAEVGDRPRPMTETELLRLTSSHLIDIGGHTKFHADLSTTPEHRAEDEIRGDRATLVELTGQEVIAFAYPFGRCGTETARLLAAAGYSSAFWSRYHVATALHDPFFLPRIQVTNLSGPEFSRRLDLLLGPANDFPQPSVTVEKPDPETAG